MSAKFIVVEGIDFAGKTTCLRNIENYLTGQNAKFYTCNEYKDLDFCASLRDLLNFREFEYAVETELFMYCASRIEHTRNHIKPNLDNGFSVLADRYSWSTFAYQGARDPETTDKVVDIAKSQLVTPDLTIYLDIPVSLMRERAESRGKGLDFIESRGDAFFEAVRSNFISMVENDPKAILIDGSQPISKVFAESLDAVKQCLEIGD